MLGDLLEAIGAALVLAAVVVGLVASAAVMVGAVRR